MAPMVERRHSHHVSPDQSISPIKRRRSPHQRERSPRNRSPTRTTSHRKSSPEGKFPKSHSRGRSPTKTSSSRPLSPHTKGLSRIKAESETIKVRNSSDSRDERRKRSASRSLSPRSRRLMQARSERESEKVKGREHREHVNDRDTHDERRSTRDRHDRTVSPKERNNRSRHRSPSPARVSRGGEREKASRSRETEQYRGDDLDSIAMMKAAEESLEAKEKNKEKPSFEYSGKLADETNKVRGVTLLFNEPPDARKPDTRWRLYVFKAGEVLNEPLYVHRQSCYLFGRERRVADIPTDHPSCSKQHAVIQYRLVDKEQPDGLISKEIRPYIMDLGSTNGTFVNDNRIEPQRYYELIEKDTIKFGNSSREYVILHENSAG